MTTEPEYLSAAEPLVLIGVGGFAGAVLRHLVSAAIPSSFPWGTLLVNVGGAFLLSVLLYEAHVANALSAETRLVVGVGFCSSLTTYSTFAVETTQLTPGLAAANVGANYALAIGGVLLGRVVARWAS